MTEQERLEREAQELETLRRNSPAALPDNPTAAGWTPSQIKEKFYAAILYLYTLFKDERNTKNLELEKIVKNHNDSIGNLNNLVSTKADEKTVDNLNDRVTILESKHGKSKVAIIGDTLVVRGAKIDGDTLAFNGFSVVDDTLIF